MSKFSETSPSRRWNFFFLLINLFIYLHFIYVCVGFSLRRAGATLRCDAGASHCGAFSCCGARALEHRLSSSGTWASLLRGMWDLPRPGLEPVSPTLAGGFLTTAPPGRSRKVELNFSPHECGLDLVTHL